MSATQPNADDWKTYGRETRIADGVLESLAVVNDADLTPKPRPARPAEVAPQNLKVTPHAREKFAHYFNNRGLHFSDIHHYLYHSKPEQLTNELRHSFSDTFGLKADARVSIRASWAGPSMMLCFIVADGEVIEIVTWRGLRQLRKRAMHRAKVQPAGMTEAERVREVSKKVFKVRLQGGLIRQERMPRDRWK